MAFVHGVRYYSFKDAKSSQMEIALERVRVDVIQVDVDARKQDWRAEGWNGPDSHVADRITGSSHEVVVLTPYAEASVSMALEEGNEQRRCSLCLN